MSATEKRSKRLTMSSDGVDMVRAARKSLTKLLLALEDVRDVAFFNGGSGAELDVLVPLVRAARRNLHAALDCETKEEAVIAPTMPRPPETDHGAN
jgi:hypothetical protein